MHRSTQYLAAHAHNKEERDRRTHDGLSTYPGEPLTLDVVHSLASLSPELTVSLYVPTHRPTAERQQDHIRLANLLNQARTQILRVGGEARARDMLGPIDELVANPTFWTHPSEGVILFCREGNVRIFRSPTSIPELAIVSEHCHIKPLMAMLQDDGRFYVLELDDHAVHFHFGSRFVLSPVDLPDASKSREEVDGQLESPHHADVRLTDIIGKETRRASFPAVHEQEREKITEKFRNIDTSICKFIQEKNAPLIIIGTERLRALYAAVNHYPHLASAEDKGMPHLKPGSSLLERAWETAGPILAQGVLKARERFDKMCGTEHAISDFTAILRACSQGRIGHLYAASDSDRWGTYDAINGQVREHQPRWPEDDDLVNIAIIMALASRSEVRVLPREQIPGKEDLAALLRF